MIKNNRRVLSVFSLVMINVIAVDNLRSLPISAEYGLSLIFYYIVGVIVFMLPTAMVAAELATGWPNTGGVYVWVREAFGKRAALLTIWLQWIYNVVWYPTMLAFLAAIFTYLFDPSLAKNKDYMVLVIIGMFWFATLLNSFNMKTSSFISTLGALLGTIIPMLVILALGLFWWFSGKPSQINFSWTKFFPDLSNIDNLSFMTGILFGLIGMEMSAVHAEEVKNPQRDYPRALLYSTILIAVTLIMAALAIAIVIPHAQLNLVTGLLDAYREFFNAYHMNWMTPIIVIAIVIGGLGGISTWVIGPTKGLLVASEDGSIPPLFQRTNKNRMPIMLLISQAIIVTILSFVFLYMPSVNSSYWLLTALTSQLALLYYIFLFAAAIKLRYSHPNTPRSYKIPGGKVGMIIVSGIGIIACILVIIFGFLPPPGMDLGNLDFFWGFLGIGILIFCAIPLIAYQLRKPHWKTEVE